MAWLFPPHPPAPLKQRGSLCICCSWLQKAKENFEKICVCPRQPAPFRVSNSHNCPAPRPAWSQDGSPVPPPPPFSLNSIVSSICVSADPRLGSCAVSATGETALSRGKVWDEIGHGFLATSLDIFKPAFPGSLEQSVKMSFPLTVHGPGAGTRRCRGPQSSVSGWTPRMACSSSGVNPSKFWRSHTKR